MAKPLEYKADSYPRIAAELCRLGATTAEIAQALGVKERAVKEWLVKFPEFGQAVRVGKQSADERVVMSLYNRAVGYSFDSEKIFYNNKTGETIRVPITEHVPPDVTACIFWLKNRDRENWRDVHNVHHDANITLEKLVNASYDLKLVEGGKK